MIREHDGLKSKGIVAELVLSFCYRIAGYFRRKRLAEFARQFPSTEYSAMIDVGGTFSFWEGSNRRVTIVNPLVSPCQAETMVSIKGDGRALEFPDKYFALAFSNSAIEHMCREDQRKFAAELRRVGQAVYCQTPNLWFPYDTHYIAFFWHWFPGVLRNWFIARYLTGWGWVFRPDRTMVLKWADEVNLIGRREFAKLFPDCVIEEEKFLGMTKSFIAVRKFTAQPVQTKN
jgi:hypothetical protein